MRIGNFQIKKSSILIFSFLIMGILMYVGYSYVNSDINVSSTLKVKQFTPTVLYSVIKKNSTIDNTSSTYVNATTGIDFKSVSSETNGRGIYLKAETKDDKFPMYYYRGAVTNNNVVFNNFCWKIIRTTDTGGVKMIYNGTPTEESGAKVCNNTGDATITEKVALNSGSGTLAYVGYKYGTVYEVSYISTSSISGTFASTVTYDNSSGKYTLSSDTISDSPNYTHHYSCGGTETTCTEVQFYYSSWGGNYYYIKLKDGVTSGEQALDLMFQNDADSTLKDYLENDWYENNMKNVTGKLEDTVFCNGRDYNKQKNEAFLDNGGITIGFYFDHGFTADLNLTCASEIDRFTVSPNNGNGELKYPIGIIDGDEVKLAGLNVGSAEANNYLNSGAAYSVISPMMFQGNTNIISSVNATGKLSPNSPNIPMGIRPVVSLKMGTRFVQGNGEPTSPYIIE